MDRPLSPLMSLGAERPGAVAALVRDKDWSATPLGPPHTWPQSLQTSVSTCLSCSFPIVLWWGPDLIMIYNDAYRPMLGIKHPDALGRKGQQVWAEIWDIIGPMFNRVLERGEAAPADDLRLMLERKGYPEECYFSFSYSPIFDENGGVGGVFCPVMETTEQVIGARRLETLRRLAALPHARTVTEASIEACDVLAGNGADVPFALVYLLSDDGRTAYLAASAGIAAGRSCSPPEIALDGENVWPLGRALREPIVIANGGRELPTGDWSVAPKDTFLAPLLLPGGDEAAGVIIVGVNPHKDIDRSYRSFLDLLAGQMSSRLADALAYEAERKRAEALAELDRAKTTFFSNISHEFRTPLTLILGPLDALLNDPDLQDREQLEVVRRNALRMLKLVNALLDFVRIEAGREQVRCEPTDLSQYTRDLAGVFRSAIERAGLRLTVDCPDLGTSFQVDRGIWEKIVLNLLSNALKFTFAGGITVTLKRRGNSVELAVRDTGVGIPSEELPRIFDRFHRVENARARTHEGSGIGLALVRELVQLHGGTISVESTEGEGTCFRVSVPFGSTGSLADQAVTAPAEADAFAAEAMRWLPDTVAETGGPVLPDTRRPARVLIADDNADMREYLQRLLTAQFRIELTENGEAALDAARKCKPDLILSDVMMPRLDGFGLLKQLREDESLRDTPVIFLSARAGEEARIDGLTLGADDYLVKPFSARELLAKVESQLKLKGLREAGRAQIETLIDRAPLGVYLIDADLRIRLINPIAKALFSGIEEPVVGRSFDEVMHRLWDKDHADELVAVVRETLATGAPHSRNECGHRRVDRGLTEFYEWRVDRIPLPDGRHGAVCYFRDISLQVMSRLKIAESEERFRALIHASAQIVWSTAPNGEVCEDLPLWRAFTGQTYQEMAGWGWLNAVHPDDRAAIAETGRRGADTGTAYETEFRVRHRTGDWRWMVARSVPLKAEDGTVRGWVGMNTDITDRKQAEQTQHLLINELNHRVKNTLASVQAIVHHTLRQTRDPDAFAASLTGRIQSLARVHTLLSSGSWKGAYLSEIIRDQILVDPATDDRVRITGPLVRLEPQMSLHVALMLHEMATNSAKYGAFSSAAGRVDIAWKTADRRLELTWHECGGPPVMAPSRRGFGSMLIEQSAKGAGGSATVNYAPEGVSWDIVLPLSARAAHSVKQDGASALGSAETRGDLEAAAIALAGKQFLVVEDEPLVVLDLVGALESVGAEAVSAGTPERALAMLKLGRFDGALLDANLRGRPVDDVAHALNRARVPFAFITGYGRESLPRGFESISMLMKPFSEDGLIALAARLIG